MNQQIIYNRDEWVDAVYPGIKEYSLRVSKYGEILDRFGNITKPTYVSSNGNVYTLITKEDNTLTVVPFSYIIGLTFIPVPAELSGVPITIRHIDGDKLNISATNLEWVEDVEEWRDIIYKDVKRGYYQISNWGRVRSIYTGKPIIMKTFDSFGYDRINLVADNKYHSGRKCSIHQLVAVMFVPGYTTERCIVNHIDNNQKRNHFMNLEWVTSKENTAHAKMIDVMAKGLNHGMAIISEIEAAKICESLNRHKGSINDVYNELKDEIVGLKPTIISSIKYEETFVYVSRDILTADGKLKIERQTDENIIIEIATCLKNNKGDVKKTRDALIYKYPWLTLGWIWHLKDKSVAKEITDRIFSTDEFPKITPLSEDQVHEICKNLVKFNMSQSVVYENLKDKIPGLTKDKVRSIKEKKAWVNISDKYFKK